jgi:hypothetical protein
MLLTDFAPAVVVAQHVQHGFNDLAFARTICRDYRVVNALKEVEARLANIQRLLAEDAIEENHGGTLIASQH